MLTFYFTGVEGRMTRPELLTSGMMGKELRLEFSEEWEELTKTVVFSNGETTLDRLYTGQTMVIPAQILEKPLEKLTVGLYGVSEDGLLVIPTVRAEGPVILPGVDPTGDPGMDPSQPVWTQLLGMIEQLEKLTAEEKEKLVAAMEELTGRMELCPKVAYYGSLSAAISDVNNGVTDNALSVREGAKAAVFTAHTGARTVMLLEDVSENTEIVVSRDIDLALNGKTLTFTVPAAYLIFGEGTDCRIFGNVNGSTVSKTCDCSAYGSNPRLIYSKANLLEVHGGDYVFRTATQKPVVTFNIAIGAGKVLIDGCTVVTENTDTSSVKAVRCIQNDAKRLVLRNTSLSAVNGQAQCALTYTNAEIENCVMMCRSGESTSACIFADESAVLDLHGCEVKAVSNSGNSRAMVTSGTSIVHAKDCMFLGDAINCHATGPHAIGIRAQSGSEITLDDCTVFGTHSGISASGKVYINGGVYTGYCHGGVYISGDGTGLTYINDATLRCGNYEGEFDYSGKTEEVYGSMYIGGNANANNLTAYLDGCTITNEGNNPIVMRGTDGEKNNTIYISNSTVLGVIRIDNDTLKLMVGTGTNISEIKIDNPSRAEFTQRLYRKNDGDKILDGRDYTSLTAWMEDAAGLVKTVGGVAADKNGNVPLDWVANTTFESLVILEETSVSGGFYGGLTYEKLEGQEELAILCDGRLYLCVPEFGYSEGDGYYVYLGNKSLLSASQTDTGEPFLIWGFKSASLILSFRESGSHTMSITGYRYEYAKLPARYLPEDAIREIVAAVLAEANAG